MTLKKEKKKKTTGKKYKKNNNQNKRNVNYLVVLFSLIAIICLILAFLVHWIFMLPAVLLAWLNQKELFGKK